MKYMSHESTVGPESLTVAECDVPKYDKEKEVLIKVESTAVNRADLLQVSRKLDFVDVICFSKVSRKIPTSKRRHKHYWTRVLWISSGSTDQ